jgi:hypothetical protein
MCIRDRPGGGELGLSHLQLSLGSTVLALAGVALAARTRGRTPVAVNG